MIELQNWKINNKLLFIKKELIDCISSFFCILYQQYGTYVPNVELDN